ncbi:MAG: ABC transporter permease, partial [Hyphomicrobiaceae bacterium]
IMVFILSLGFYVTPALVGGLRNLTISTLIGQQVTEVLNWPFAGALAGTLLMMTLALVALFRRFLQLRVGA